MAEIVDFDLYKELMKSKRVESSKVPVQPEKHLGALIAADKTNLGTLKEYGIELLPSEWLVLSIEPEILTKTLLRGKDLGFLDAYIQNPTYLKQDVDAVIKRIGKLDSLGIEYKNAKGKYSSFLFSERGYNYVLSQNQNQKVEKSNNQTPSINDIELKEFADRVMETFDLMSESSNIYLKLSNIEKEGLGIKETLLETFKSYSDNMEYLSSCIDEIIAEYRENEMGRVA